MLAADVATGEPACPRAPAREVRVPRVRCLSTTGSPLAVLAVHGLLGDAEPPGDVLPGPPELPRVLDLDDLQPLGERSQGRHGAEPDIRIGSSC